MSGDPFGAGWRSPTLRGKNGRPGTTGPDLRGDEYSSPSVPFGLTDSCAATASTIEVALDPVAAGEAESGKSVGTLAHRSEAAVRPAVRRAEQAGAGAAPWTANEPSHRRPEPKTAAQADQATNAAPMTEIPEAIRTRY
jgi:hypothetical protein